MSLGSVEGANVSYGYQTVSALLTIFPMLTLDVMTCWHVCVYSLLIQQKAGHSLSNVSKYYEKCSSLCYVATHLFPRETAC